MKTLQPTSSGTTRPETEGPFKKGAARVTFMKKRTGRPSKGPRSYVNAPINDAAVALLERYCELTGESKGPTVARIFEAHLADLGLEELEAGAAQPRFELDEAKKTA